jgi:hypothetical protein
MEILWELLDSQTIKASLQYLGSILLDTMHCKDSYIDIDVQNILMWV